jgi:hypothetical protein
MSKNITNFIIFVSIFALISTMFAIYVEPAKASEQIVIANHQGILESTGYFNVVGEVKNTGDTPAQNVYVKITFTSSEGDDIDEMDSLIRIILPGRRSPFMGTAAVAGSLVTSYKVELMDLTMPSEELPQALEIVSATSKANVINNMMITGTVKNTGAEAATYTRVYATAYDRSGGTGNVVAVTSATAQPYNLDPGQTGTFQMGFFMTAGKSYASIVIVAESDQYEVKSEYTMAVGATSTDTPSPTSLTSTNTPSTTSLDPSPTVPEFPVSIALVFLIVALLVVSVAVKKNRSILPKPS